MSARRARSPIPKLFDEAMFYLKRNGLKRSQSSAGPIFIGGTGRCGTTLLTKILSRLQGVFSYPYESKFLVAPGGLLFLARKRWEPEYLLQFSSLVRDRWFDRRGRQGQGRQVGLRTLVDREHLDAALARLRERALRSRGHRDYGPAATFCADIFEPGMKAANAHRWSEKTPRNVLFVDQLYRSFPAMRFIHIIRDGRDVVASMLAKGFWPLTGQGFPRLREFKGPLTADKCARYWVEVLAATRRAAANVPDENYLEIRLEDLAKEPAPALRRLCAFLNEDFHEELLEQNLSRTHSGRWRRDLSSAERAAVEEILSDPLRREGYANIL